MNNETLLEFTLFTPTYRAVTYRAAFTADLADGPRAMRAHAPGLSHWPSIQPQQNRGSNRPNGRTGFAACPRHPARCPGLPADVITPLEFTAFTPTYGSVHFKLPSSRRERWEIGPSKLSGNGRQPLVQGPEQGLVARSAAASKLKATNSQPLPYRAHH